MRSYIIQPEDRHQIIFGLLKRILNKNNKTIYIKKLSKKLPFSNNQSDEICFNSWGFTKYTLINFIRILSYSKFIIVVHSCTRFNIDLRRFHKKNIFSYYFLIRSFLDKLFFILLNLRGEIKVCLLEDQTIKYIKNDAINKVLSKFFKIKYLNLTKINEIDVKKVPLKKLSYSRFNNIKKIKLLSIGEFSEKRISKSKLIQMKNYFEKYKIQYTLDVCGKFDTQFKERIETIGINLNCMGFVSEAELSNNLEKSDFVIAPYPSRLNDYGFWDTYFETKTTGIILFNKPILLI